jgi:hypothetical protein
MTLTDVLALWGALLSTGLAAFKIAEYRRDRPLVRITLTSGMKATPGSVYGDMTLLLVKVANVGRRPISITHVSLRMPRGDTKYLLCADASSATYPVELTENRAHAFLFNEDELRGRYGLSPSDYLVAVQSSGGTEYWSRGPVSRLWRLGRLR